MPTRRSLLAGFGALVAAPVVITTPGLLMPVRTIAAVPWVFDPVAMATRCVATIGGIDHFSPAEWRHPRTGEVRRYMRAVSRPLQDDEARARVLASNANVEKWADAAAHDEWHLQKRPTPVASGDLQFPIIGTRRKFIVPAYSAA